MVEFKTGKSQRELWEKQHLERAGEHEELEDTPNEFGKKCIQLIPENGTILEIGAANGRDARYFAKEKGCRVIATDFSEIAAGHLQAAAIKDRTSCHVYPVVADAKNLPITQKEYFDAVYARSSLHLDNEELDKFMEEVATILKSGGYLMIEGKPKEDFKISRSEEVKANMHMDHDGHLRRAWSEEGIKKIVDKLGFQLISINRSTENWHGVETQFINFIAKKYG
ncbi:MAG: hypothetical protein COT92_03705 [Candidatus Doudnabacteria bacterium CG10_big_fil_rev_8_21_14_0_10_42_18]|uniref:Methyltransferase domain-containing protein n=1 Tax=Candidatus Doudnabacteria bacterium CG10_big_fil_rev_8_21_14_0_10_42_18 TaxID=1974552 RepID=A0A2H0VA18_9BACT|nr:MAG: hypothetical protein COT92_03705 [Candidatus Doudnabacteria bacterium CG10_big_fil_rev_8_21_14_0_10_42_18]